MDATSVTTGALVTAAFMCRVGVRCMTRVSARAMVSVRVKANPRSNNNSHSHLQAASPSDQVWSKFTSPRVTAIVEPGP